MGTTKVIAMVSCCLVLLLSNIANAAMPCCCILQDTAPEETTQNSMDMPCHQQDSKSDSQSMGSCSDCGCIHTTQTLFTPIIPPKHNKVVTFVLSFTYQDVYPGETQDIFQPPKFQS